MKPLLVFLVALSAYSQNAPNPQTLTGVTVNAWGDSLTAGNEDGTGNTYPLYLASLLKTTVNNDGIGGNTSTQIATRFLATPSTFNTCNAIWAGRTITQIRLRF